MAREWPIVTINDIRAPASGSISIGPFGSRMKAETYVPVGVPVIRGTNLGSTRAFVGDFVYITPEFAQSLGNSNLYDGDLVFPHRGNIGEVGIVTGTDTPHCVLSSSMMKLSVDRSRVEPTFVFYYFRSHVGRHELLKNASQVGTPGIATPLTSLRGLSIPLPPLREQRAIAAVLGALDDKIEVNRKTARVLEGIARAVFTSWFVDFDPLRRAAEGKLTGLPADLAALFPKRLVDSPIGEVPEGWRVGALDDIIDIESGGTPATSNAAYWGGEIPWFSVKDAPADGDVWVMATEKRITQLGLDNCAAKLLPVGTTIISARGTVGKLAMVGVPMAMNQSCYGIRGKKGYPDSFIYFVLRRAIADLQQQSHGSVFDTITRDTFKTAQIVKAPAEAATAFDRSIGSAALARIRETVRQSATLAALRDALLPKLISGELRIADAERIIGRATATGVLPQRRVPTSGADVEVPDRG